MAEDTKVSKLNRKEMLDHVTSTFSSAAKWDNNWREKARINYGYYFGDGQWTADEVASLNERKQSAGVYNHIKPAIDSIIGGERKNRPKITMIGRTPDDGDIAEVKTNLYDFISYNTRSDDELDKVVRDALVTGRGWMHVYPDMKNGKFDDIQHDWIDYRDMFVDGLSKRDDLSDARYLHQAVFTDSDIIKRSFKKFKEHTAEDANGFTSSSDDNLWFENNDRKRPRLINTWYRAEDGQIISVIWVHGQMLHFDKTPYRYDGFPYAQYTIERDLENQPLGIVTGMISAQDEVNKRHSKALHYLNAKQVWAEESAFVKLEDAKKSLAKPDGITMFQDGALTEKRAIVLDNVQLASTHIELMGHAKNEILSVAGINAGYVGQAGGQYDSAKKNQQNISQAQNVLVPMLNRLRISRYQIAYITMSIASDFYTEERLIRILQANGKYGFMPINGKVLLDDGTVQQMNNMSSNDIDIIIEDAPSSLNEQDEQLNILLGIQGQTGQPIPPEILLRYTKLRDKESLAEELKEYNNIQGQLNQAMQQIEQQNDYIKQLGGQIKVQQNNLIQTETARKVDSEVNKQMNELGL